MSNRNVMSVSSWSHRILQEAFTKQITKQESQDKGPNNNKAPPPPHFVTVYYGAACCCLVLSAFCFFVCKKHLESQRLLCQHMAKQALRLQAN